MSNIKTFLIPQDLYSHFEAPTSGHETIRFKVEDGRMTALKKQGEVAFSYYDSSQDLSFFLQTPSEQYQQCDLTAEPNRTYMAKLNKHNDPTHTIEEVRVSRLLRDLLNDLTGEGRVVSSPVHLGVGYKEGDDQLRVQAVVAEMFDGFTSFNEFNLIDMIAQIELGELNRFEDAGLNDKYKAIVEALIEDSDQRLRLFKQYMTDLYLRRLTHEDDFHADNVGTNFSNGIALADLNILQIDFDMAVQPLRAAKGSDNTRASQAQLGPDKLKYTDESIAHFYKHSRSGFWMSTGNIIQTPHFALTNTFASTNNKGRYSDAEARRFKQLCKIPDYKDKINEVIATVSYKFLNYDPDELYLKLKPLDPSNLKKDYGVVLSDDECRRTDLALCQFVADQQADLAEILADSTSETAQIVNAQRGEGYNSALVNNYKNKLSQYQVVGPGMTAGASPKCKLAKLLDRIKDKPIRNRLQIFTSAFSETFNFGDLGRKKLNYLKYFKHEFIRQCRGVDDFKQLVHHWKKEARHQDNVITQVRKVSMIGRMLKRKRVFNKFTSTYVSMRDLLIKEIIARQSESTDNDEITQYSDLLNQLKRFQHLRVSSSYNPVKYSVRFRMGVRYALWGNYNPISVGSYWQSRKDKHGALTAASRIVVRALPKLFEVILLALEELFRSIRRQVFQNDASAFELRNKVIVFPFKMLDLLLNEIDDKIVGRVYKFVTDFNYARDLGLTNTAFTVLFKFIQSLTLLPLLNLLLIKAMDFKHKAIKGLVIGIYYTIMALPMLLRATVASALQSMVPLLTQGLPTLLQYTAFAALTLTFHTFKALRHVMRRIASPFQSFRDYQNWIDQKYEAGTAFYHFAHIANAAFSALVLIGLTVGAAFAAPAILPSVAALAVPSALILKFLALTGLAQALGVAGALATAMTVVSTVLGGISSPLHRYIKPSKPVASQEFFADTGNDEAVHELRTEQEDAFNPTT